VAADDSEAHFENFDGVFDSRCASIDVSGGDWDDVAGITGDEEIAGLGLKDEIGENTRVGAGNEEVLRALRLSEEVEMIAARRKGFVAKAFVARE